MKIAVLYRSMTGHSKKIARQIAQELQTEAQDIKKKPALTDVDLAFIVGGLYSGKSLPEMLTYVRTLSARSVKKVALLTSSAADKRGQDEVRSILESNGVTVEEEEFRCFGGFLFIKMGHPNKDERADAVKFAKKIAEQVSGQHS